MNPDPRTALQAALPVQPLPAIAAAAERAAIPVYLVGGAVRDALLGVPLEDLDLAVEGDLDSLLAELEAAGGSILRRHTRFDTATLELGGRRIDLARSRRERYPRPGALPEVEPAPIRVDLARRDFTVNAMALGLGPGGSPRELIDPYDGLADLAAGVLRMLHERSFEDDPTRALRGARYAARLDLAPEPATLDALRQTDLGLVSAPRVEAELRRIAADRECVAAIGLLAEWGILPAGATGLELAREIDRLTGTEPWSGLGAAARQEAIVAAASDPSAGADPELKALGSAAPPRPSAAAALARPLAASPHRMLLARALGADWLDRWLGEWAAVELGVSGQDLIDAGAPRGPGLGAALDAALNARLDGELGPGREEQLAWVLERAGSVDGGDLGSSGR